MSLEYLKDFCTDRQWEIVQAYESHGSHAKAAKELGVSKSLVGRTIDAAKKKASSMGKAPGHFNDGVAPGYRMGKVTIQRTPKGVERVWERQHPELVDMEAIMSHFEARIETFPRLKPIKVPTAVTNPKLFNFLGLFDLHIGEKISSDDPMGRWDIAIAKETIIRCATYAMHNAPKADRLVLCFGGDAMHYDGVLPVTPTSRHVLHSDGDFTDMAEATVDIAISVIDEALRTYKEVYLIWATGNHDLATSKLIRALLSQAYRKEPRLKVIQSRLDYYALRFGKVMLGIHHGHGAKLQDLPGIFASMFREMWGLAEYAYSHRGHEHHIHQKEKGGMVNKQHPTIAPNDDYALGKGLISKRGCTITTYHEDYGEVCEYTARPEMLMA